ncbi:MAG: hypothetical protein KDH96_00745 [Candidatus Riesia sp.]|nr:hypothetical protein [Candidatus Riesia sp.]
MSKFLKLNNFLLKFLTMGILSIKQNIVTKNLIDMQGDISLHKEVQDLFLFAQKTQLYPVGCEMYNDEYNKNLSKILDIINCSLSIEDYLQEDIQQEFYCTFLKLICLDVKKCESSDEEQVISFIENDVIPELILMLLNHCRAHFFRSYKTIDLCLSRFISKDQSLLFVIKYHKNGF